MSSRRHLARHAVFRALETRRATGFTLWEPVCVFDLADRAEIDVRFMPISSLEAMYVSYDSGPVIFVSADRPAGRQVFSCAHEIGHHVFGHGHKIDDVTPDQGNRRLNNQEYLATIFASHLLMPKSAVAKAFNARRADPESCDARDIYCISKLLGVGYSTLVHHLAHGLGMISDLRAKSLAKASPKAIRSRLLGREVVEDVTVADLSWQGRPVDIQVGDYVLLPIHSDCEGLCVRRVPSFDSGSLYQAVRPGKGRIFDQNSEWATHVRVRRRHYTGRSVFRHLEDPDDE